MEMTIALLISYIVGGIFSLLQEFVTGWGTWWENQTDLVRRLVSLGVSVVAALIVFGMACGNLLSTWFPELSLTCDQNGLLLLLGTIVGSITGSQTVHPLLKRS